MVRSLQMHDTGCNSPGTVWPLWRTGDVIYIYMLGNPIIVLNSAEVINDLFEKRGSFYSSRPCRTMVAELYVILVRHN